MEEMKNNSEIKGSNKLLFIRHGITEFNYIARKEKETKEFIMDRYVTNEMMDAALHPIGIEQAIEKRPFVENIPVEYVFVSIFRRALETSYFLFLNHPNREQIKIIVHPLIGEKVNCNYDLMRDYASIREEFESKTELTYDFALFDAYENPRLYYIYEINDPPRDQLLKCTFVIITHNEFFRHFSATEVTKKESNPINGCRITNLEHTIYENLNQLPNKLIYI